MFLPGSVCAWEHWDSVLVSHFDIRISGFAGMSDEVESLTLSTPRGRGFSDCNRQKEWIWPRES